MTISVEQTGQIIRLYHVEKWPVGTIAKQLGVHHSTVTRAIERNGLPRRERIMRPSIVEPYIPFMIKTLEEYPTLAASRLYQMVQERGYSGGPDHFRYQVSKYRPKKRAEAFLRLKTLPGEQAQVDWGHFGKIQIGKAERHLMAFVMVLSWSRRVFLRFYLDQRMANFLRGHEAAFNEWGGVPKVLLYDNLKCAVLERKGDAIRFNPVLLQFAGHYRYEPRPVAVCRGNEKGRVERAIRYIRCNFFAARNYRDLADLNEQAAQWCDGQSSNRPCPEDKTLTVREAYTQERSKLISLPDNPWPVDEREAVKTNKAPYARFDLNDYSIPSQYVRRQLTVVANEHNVRILDGANIIAEHTRSYDRDKQVEDPAHVAELEAFKRKAKRHRGQDRLCHAAPSSQKLLSEAALRGSALGAMTTALLRLLDTYGAKELEEAIQEALARGVPHHNAVRQVLFQRRESRNAPPPIAVQLPENKKVRNLAVKPHALSDYDNI